MIPAWKRQYHWYSFWKGQKKVSILYHWYKFDTIKLPFLIPCFDTNRHFLPTLRKWYSKFGMIRTTLTASNFGNRFRYQPVPGTWYPGTGTGKLGLWNWWSSHDFNFGCLEEGSLPVVGSMLGLTHSTWYLLKRTALWALSKPDRYSTCCPGTGNAFSTTNQISIPATRLPLRFRAGWLLVDYSNCHCSR